MGRITYQVWLLSYYREAELRGADLLQRLLRKTDDPDLQLNLTHHFADEARHAWLWTELIHKLGGTPLTIRQGYQRYLQRQVGLPSSVLDLLALTHVVEERVQQRYCEHVGRPGENAQTVAVLRTIIADEQWHLAWLREWLVQHEQKAERGWVEETLSRYRTLEAKAYAELRVEEERLRRQFGLTPLDSNARW